MVANIQLHDWNDYMHLLCIRAALNDSQACSTAKLLQAWESQSCNITLGLGDEGPVCGAHVFQKCVDTKPVTLF